MLRLTEILERLSRRLDGLVHASVADPAIAARHRGFLAVHLGVGLAALAIGAALGTDPTVPPALPVQLVLLAAALGHAGLLALRILARGRAERTATAEAEARHRLVAEGLDDRLVTLHAPNGAVLHASAAAHALLGVAPARLMDAGLLGHVHVADRPAFLTALSEADRTGGAVRAALRLRTAEGDVFEAELTARPVRDADGAPCVAAVLRPVAAERTAQTLRAETERRLAAAEAERSAFLATLGHELRTPLNAMLGFAELLGEGRGASLDRARQSDYAALIRASGVHLLEIVEGFLDIGRLEAGATEIVPEPVALGPVIEAAVAMIGHQARQRGVTLRLDLAAGLPDVLADRAASRRIVLNLLSNAVKFSRPGGVIVVSAATEGGRVVLSVADRGIGIAAADLPRVGTPFVRLAATGPDAAEGSGLGLSIVKRLAALMGGTMTIDSALGRGTTVRVALPRAPDADRAGFSERVERRA